MISRKTFLFLAFAALLLKLVLFGWVISKAPDSMTSPDSGAYLQLAQSLYEKGTFSLPGSGEAYIYRTPGYPVFLAFFHEALKLPFARIILIQIILVLAAAWAVYETARELAPETAALAALFVLWDVPATIYSMKILTEAPFLFLLSFFILGFVRYLKGGEWKNLVFSALALVAAVYVRSAGYYLGLLAAVFILYAGPKNFKTRVIHALIFLAWVYALPGLWQLRNHSHYGVWLFDSASNDNFKWQGLFAVCKDAANGSLCLVLEAGEGLVRFLTKPGLLKHYHSSAILILGQIVALPVLVLQLAGFAAGCFFMRGRRDYQFLLLGFLYFAAGSVLNATGSVGERYRVQALPALALLASWGWVRFTVWRFTRTLAGGS